MHTYEKTKQFSSFDISTIINNPTVYDRDINLLLEIVDRNIQQDENIKDLLIYLLIISILLNS